MTTRRHPNLQNESYMRNIQHNSFNDEYVIESKTLNVTNIHRAENATRLIILATEGTLFISVSRIRNCVKSTGGFSECLSLRSIGFDWRLRENVMLGKRPENVR